MEDLEFKNTLKTDINKEFLEVKELSNNVDFSTLEKLSDSQLIMIMSKIKQFKFFIKNFSNANTNKT